MSIQPDNQLLSSQYLLPALWVTRQFILLLKYKGVGMVLTSQSALRSRSALSLSCRWISTRAERMAFAKYYKGILRARYNGSGVKIGRRINGGFALVD